MPLPPLSQPEAELYCEPQACSHSQAALWMSWSLSSRYGLEGGGGIFRVKISSASNASACEPRTSGACEGQQHPRRLPPGAVSHFPSQPSGWSVPGLHNGAALGARLLWPLCVVAPSLKENHIPNKGEDLNPSAGARGALSSCHAFGFNQSRRGESAPGRPLKSRCFSDCSSDDVATFRRR